MALDPNFVEMFKLPNTQFEAPPPEVSAAMVREAARALLPPVVPQPMHSVRDFDVPGPAGTVRVRLYAPSARTDLPLIVFLHGGGWVVCDLDSHDPFCRKLALATGCAVVSVDYRLSPETKFPGAIEDGYAVLEHFAKHGAREGIDPTRLAVCGDSAGASLAIAIAMLARDRRGPALCYQALLCPVTDATMSAPSYTECGSGYRLSAGAMRWFWECYLGSPADARNPLASPSVATAAQLAGLPPATIQTAEYDPLRDEAEAFGQALRAAGVEASIVRYRGMIHDFQLMSFLTTVADQAIAHVAADLRAALCDPATTNEGRLATVRALYSAAAAGDWAAVEANLTDDLVIVEASSLPFAGTWRGKQAVQQIYATVIPMLPLKDIRFRDMLVGGDQVAVVVDLIVEKDGRELPLEVVETLRFRGAQVCEIKPFYFDSALVNAVAKRG